jgi:hypothetical protein
VFTFVNVDKDMIPRPVPPVYPTTYAEDARYLEAHRRNVRHNDRDLSRSEFLEPAEERGPDQLAGA